MESLGNLCFSYQIRRGVGKKSSSLFASFVSIVLILVSQGQNPLAQNMEELSEAVTPLVRVAVSSSSNYLVKGERVLLMCTMEEEEVVGMPSEYPHADAAFHLSHIQWFKDDHPIPHDKDGNVHVSGATLVLLPTKHLGRHEGEYQCSGRLRGTALPSLQPTVFSAKLRLMEARIERFPRREDFEDVHDSHTVSEAFQGEVAYIPCSNIPESVPGPPILSFERKLPGSAEFQPITAETNKARYLLTQTGLQIAVVQPSDAGKYRCLAKNSLTNRTRKSKKWIELKILFRSDVRNAEKPFSMASTVKLVYPDIKRTVLTVAEGSDVLLDCVAGSGGQIRWEKANQTNTDIGLWSTAVGSKSGSRTSQIWGNLRINKVSRKDGGIYLCRVIPPVHDEPKTQEEMDKKKNQSRSTSEAPSNDGLIRRHPTAEFELVVDEKPEANLTVDFDPESNKWLVACKVRRSARANMRLTLDGEPFSGHSGKGTTNGGSYTVVKQSYAGLGPIIGYEILLKDHLPTGTLQCLVSPGQNGFASGHSENLYVRSVSSSIAHSSDNVDGTVDEHFLAGLKRPEIREGPHNTTRTVGDTVTLLCTFSGSSRAVWLKDGVELDENDGRWKVIGSGTLEIKRLSKLDEGRYTCVAVGLFSNATATAYLSVINGKSIFGDLPPLTESVDLNSEENPEEVEETQPISEFSVDEELVTTVTTLKPNPTTPQAMSFDETSEGLGSGAGETVELVNFSTTTLPATVTWVFPAENEEQEEEEDSFEEKNGSSIPPPKVFLTGSNTSVIVQWKVPQKYRGRKIIHFKIQKRKSIQGESRGGPWETLEEDLSAIHTEYTVDGLETNQRYKFRVGIAFEKGFTDSSRASKYVRVIQNSAAQPPQSAPNIIGIRPETPTSIRLEWTYPEDEPAHLTGFIITYGIAAARFDRSTYGSRKYSLTVEGSQTRDAVVQNLLAATPYQMSVVGFNGAGKSTPSKEASTNTLKQDGTPVHTTSDKMESDSETSLYGTTEAPDVVTMKKPTVFLHLESTTLIFILAGVLALLVLVLIIAAVWCTVKRRKEKKIAMAAKGKYLDASHRIFKEQATHRGGVSLFQEAFSQACDGMEPDDAINRSFLRESTAGRYRDEDSYPLDHRPPTPTVKPVSNGFVPINIYSNPIDHQDSMGIGFEYRESSEPEDLAVYPVLIGSNNRVPRSTRNMGLYDSDSQPIYGLDTQGVLSESGALLGAEDEMEEAMSTEHQGSTPECDLQNHGSFGVYGATRTSSNLGTDEAEGEQRTSFLLSPYHSALQDALPTHSASPPSSFRSSPTGVATQSAALLLNTSGTTASADSNSSPSRRTDSRQSGQSNRSRTPHIYTAAGAPSVVPQSSIGYRMESPIVTNGSNGINSPSRNSTALSNNISGGSRNAAYRDGGPKSPVIPQAEWDVMWTRGGAGSSLGGHSTAPLYPHGGGSLRRQPSDRRDNQDSIPVAPPQFFTFKPHSKRVDAAGDQQGRPRYFAHVDEGHNSRNGAVNPRLAGMNSESSHEGYNAGPSVNSTYPMSNSFGAFGSASHRQPASEQSDRKTEPGYNSPASMSLSPTSRRQTSSNSNLESNPSLGGSPGRQSEDLGNASDQNR